MVRELRTDKGSYFVTSSALQCDKKNIAQCEILYLVIEDKIPKHFFLEHTFWKEFLI